MGTEFGNQSECLLRILGVGKQACRRKAQLWESGVGRVSSSCFAATTEPQRPKVSRPRARARWHLFLACSARANDSAELLSTAPLSRCYCMQTVLAAPAALSISLHHIDRSLGCTACVTVRGLGRHEEKAQANWRGLVPSFFPNRRKASCLAAEQSTSGHRIL